MAKSIKVLVIENDPLIAQILTDELINSRETSFTVDRVRTLATALEQLAAMPFDAILLDLMLPDSSPHNALDIFTLVADATGPAPIIVLSDSNNDAFAVELFNRGAQAYVVKGDLNSAMIASMVASAVDGYHLLAEVNAQAQKLSDSELQKRQPYQWDKVTQSIFSVNMIGSSLPHLWRRSPYEAQQGLRMLRSVAKDTLCKINGLLKEGLVI